MSSRIRAAEYRLGRMRHRLELNEEESWRLTKAAAANDLELDWVSSALADLEDEFVRGRDGLTANERKWFMGGEAAT